MTQYSSKDSKLIQKIEALIKNIFDNEWGSEDFINVCKSVENLFLSERDKIADQIWRTKKGRYIKKYIEEIMVIATYLKHTSRTCRVKPFDGNQPYDAILNDDNGQEYIEVTSAEDGHLHSKIADHLNLHGHAPITFSNPESIKSDRQMVDPHFAEVVRVDSLIAESVERVKTAVMNKIDKSYAGNYKLLVRAETTNDPDNTEIYLKQARDSFVYEQETFSEIWLIHTWRDTAIQLSTKKLSKDGRE